MMKFHKIYCLLKYNRQTSSSVYYFLVILLRAQRESRVLKPSQPNIDSNKCDLLNLTIFLYFVS